MEYVEPTPELRAAFEQARAEHDNLVRRCGLPLVGLDDPAPSPRMVAESDAEDGTIQTIALAYGDPVRTDGPLVHVHTARRDRQTPPPTLVDLLEAELDRTGDDSEVPERPERAELVIDGVVHTATLQRSGDRFWAARCSRAGIEITVVARDWALTATRLVSVPDVEPYLRAHAEFMAARLAGPPDLPEPIDVEYPHRALVDAVLDQHRHIRDRLSQGRRPRVRGTGRLGGLWQATTLAQLRLTSQTPEQAKDAVTAMVNQLSQLQDDAEWFAEEPLRESAITETLMYWTELRLTVPSRPAQEAWRRYWWSRRALGMAELRGHPLAARSRAREFTRLGRDWLDAWMQWAWSRQD